MTTPLAESPDEPGEEKVMAQESDDPIVELRQYTLHPGQRETLIELFEREFIESQEAVGMRLQGQFRDRDRPERFVWLRAFSDMPSRARGLTAFYGGPVWKAHRQAANATMVDSSNVLLLKPARPGAGLGGHLVDRAPVGATLTAEAVIVATVYAFESPMDDAFLRFFEQELKPALEGAGLPVLAWLETDSSANNFPPLPVREGENVFVWFTASPTLEAHQERTSRLEASRMWRDELAPTLRRYLKSAPEILRLSPTPRSRLRA